MSKVYDTGERLLRRRIPDDVRARFRVVQVRRLDEFMKVSSVRSAVFMAEQECPYDEEFDGNDLCATHLLLLEGDRPVGTLRLRWFAEFVKIERVAVLPFVRGRPAMRMLLAHGFEHMTRKGYRLAIAQIQARLWPVWSREVHCRLKEGREAFWFSDFEYREVEVVLPEHPDALTGDVNPYQIIRPEGAWDEPGVLDASATRATFENADGAA
ncbi:MAG: GNAT family N-acetyltransferase [Hyphomonas sp.]